MTTENHTTSAKYDPKNVTDRSREDFPSSDFTIPAPPDPPSCSMGRYTIREWLDAHFEEGAASVEGVDYWGHRIAGSVQIGSSKGTAFLQHSCGGDVVISFKPDSHSWPLVIVRDDSEGEKWDREYRGVAGVKPHRPFAKLVLKQTA